MSKPLLGGSLFTTQNLKGFNPEFPLVMHLDINSCFATIEQQSNPFLRGKPVVVAAYKSPGGCIVAPSIEAKRLGIKTGMRVCDAQKIFPKVTVLEPDPWKYRQVHLALKKILLRYTSNVVPKSIDEFSLNFDGFLELTGHSIYEVARQIKQEIKNEVGEWMSVSIGIAPNRFLAKLASNLKKPDGLEEINAGNFIQVYKKLKLTDLCGIKERNAARLNHLGIFNVWDFYQASIPRLKAAFESVNGYYWYLRLRGWEIDDATQIRKSYGNSFALPKPCLPGCDLYPVISKLTEKMSFRLRTAGFQAKGICLGLIFKNWVFWQKRITLPEALFDGRDIYGKMIFLLDLCPLKDLVREVAVCCFDLTKKAKKQLNFFEDISKKESLVNSVDEINERWGNFTVVSGRSLKAKDLIKDRIAFGGIKELEEFTFRS